MSNPKKKSVPRVRSKVGAKRSRTKLLDLGQGYVSGQPQGDPQNKLGNEIQAVVTTRTALAALLGTRANLKAQLAKNAGDLVSADADYAGALVAYAGAAGTFCAGNATLLATLGVAQALAPTKPADEVIVAPVVKVAAGTLDGDVELKCGRVPYAGAYLFEYKLEPSQPADPWLGNVTTKLASTTISGLAPAQLVRVRARAIGVAPGPWSVEVVGRAK